MFEVGDEVVCVNDADYPYYKFGLKKGDVFTVLAVYTSGYFHGDAQLIDGPWISIGVQHGALKFRAECMGCSMPHFDIWQGIRFRKVERKRTREELYALIGITDMVGQRSVEVV